MPILGILLLVIQLSFAVHALKTGRPYWWVFVIMSLPIAGCLIYYFVEVFPNTRESTKAQKAAHDLIKSLTPTKEIKERIANLDTCASIDNKMALADECMKFNMYEEAIQLYTSCLEGSYQNDPHIKFELAKAYYAQQSYNDAKNLLLKLMVDQTKFKSNEVRFLFAKTLEALGDLNTALTHYAELAEIILGEEARWCYGSLLKRMGEKDKANEVFKRILKNADRAPAYYREEQKEWIKLAQGNIAM